MEFVSQFFPQHCSHCGLAYSDKTPLCPPCQAELPWILSPCEVCGRELPEKEKLICGDCLLNPPTYDKAVIPFRYDTPISTYISRLKFFEKCHYAAILGNLFLNYLTNIQDYHLPQALIPVPLHPKRISKRGYNQALEIARPLSKKLQIPLLKNQCIRTRHTKPQTEISREERKSNVKNAFMVKNLPLLQHVTLIDDVFTTGHTLEEIVKCLKKNGIEKVDVWCIAKAFQ